MTDLTEQQIIDWFLVSEQYNPDHKFNIVQLPSEWYDIRNKVFGDASKNTNPIMFIIINNNPGFSQVHVFTYVPPNKVEQLNAINWTKSFIEICDGKCGGNKEGTKSQGKGHDLNFISQGIQLAKTMAEDNF